MKTLERRIRDAILADVTDRRGWRQEWDGFDAEVRKNIKRAWERLIKAELARPPEPPEEAIIAP